LLLVESVNQKLPSSPIVIAKGWVPPRIGNVLTGVVWAAALPIQAASAAMPQVILKRSRGLGEGEGCNGGIDPVEKCYHEGARFRRICESQSAIGLHGCNL